MTMLGYYVHQLSPDLFKVCDRIETQFFGHPFGFGPFAVHWYGLAYVVGFYLAYRVMVHLAKRGLSEIKPEAIGDFITNTAIFGVVLGGRLGYMLFYNFEAFIQNPMLFFRIMDGGMASHGGIAGVALFLLWYARKHHISWTGLGDTLVCGAPLGLLTVRIANFINGELFGRITDVSWAVKFPTEIHHLDFLQRTTSDLPFSKFPQHSPDILAFYQQNFGDTSTFIDLLNPRHPSQLYEAAGEGLFLFLLLYTLRIKFPNLPRAMLTAVFFLGYAIVRILLENYREPDSGAEMIMGLTKGQFLSTFMVATGLAFLAYSLIYGRRNETSGDPARS